MYRAVGPDEPVSQGDMFDECPIFGFDADEQRIGLESEPRRWRIRVVVLTQACDLAVGKTTRVVVAAIHDAQKLVDSGVLKASLVRDQIRRHQVYGWYFLPQSGSPALPESIADLRHLQMVPLAIPNQLIERGKRRCRLETPYREHLGQHFANTYARIGLPEPYETQP
jgi:hypothetical protein